MKMVRSGPPGPWEKEGFGVKDFVRVMKALSEPNRVKILKLLQRRTLCVCEIQEALGLAQPSVSKHLKILENADLVRFEKDGLWVNYSLSDGGSTPYAATLLGNLRHWLEGDPEILPLVERLPHIRRENVCRHPEGQGAGQESREGACGA